MHSSSMCGTPDKMRSSRAWLISARLLEGVVDSRCWQWGDKWLTTAAQTQEAPTPEAARAAGMGMPTPGGGRISLVTARSLADDTADTAAPAVANGAADSDDSGLTGGALVNGGGDDADADADSSRPQLVALLNGADIGPSSSPGRQTRNRSYPGVCEEPVHGFLIVQTPCA